MLKNIKCFFIGHHSTFSDSGYPVCDLCGAHSYWDSGDYKDENGKPLNAWNRAGYLFKPFLWIKFQIERIAIRLRDLQFWRIRRKFINDDLPF